jgi:hypothetical protein
VTRTVVAWWHEAAVGIDKWDAEVYALCESPRIGLIAAFDANGIATELDTNWVQPITPLARELLKLADRCGDEREQEQNR